MSTNWGLSIWIEGTEAVKTGKQQNKPKSTEIFATSVNQTDFCNAYDIKLWSLCIYLQLEILEELSVNYMFYKISSDISFP